jgi:cytochrome c553
MNVRSDRFGLWFTLSMAGIAVAAYLVGFVWMPSVQSGAPNLWIALCRAAGFNPQSASAAPAAQSSIPSDVVWTVETRGAVSSGDAGRGGALAAPCAGCHGAKGISPSDQFPNLAGQSADAVFKQLHDFHSGKRVSPFMQGIAAVLTEPQMADLAAHFASLPAAPAATSAPPRLVTLGDPTRGLPPCAACHGPMGHKAGAPDLAGQKAAYLQAQLEAFAAGTRRNDINQQMREIAHELKPDEIAAVAKWYGAPAASAPEKAASLAQ